MLLSFVLPVYNVEPYIATCLDSLCKQDLHNISGGGYEIICVDDGSKDGSAEVIKQFQKEHSNIVLISQENQGASAARNRGLKEAKGKYIWFVDPDDYICQNCLDEILSILEENEGQVLSIGSRKVSEETTEDFGCDSERVDRELFLRHNACWNRIVRRDFLLKHNILFPEKMVLCEDVYWTFLLRMALEKDSAKALAVFKVFYYYRMRSGSLTHIRSQEEAVKNVNGYMELIRLYRLYLKENELTEKQAKHIHERILLMSHSILHLMAWGSLPKEYIREIVSRLRKDGLYPRRFLKYNLQYKGSLRTTLLYLPDFFFPIPGYYRLYCKLISKIANRSEWKE